MRKEWNFFFDCIGKAFTNKCSNFDALTQLTQQIGYGLLNNAILDIPTHLLEFIRSRKAENPQVIYFPRFLHLISFIYVKMLLLKMMKDSLHTQTLPVLGQT